MGLPIQSFQQLVHFCDCSQCGVPIYGPEQKQIGALAHKGKNNFHCINGHSQIYIGETDAEKLAAVRVELNAALERESRANRLKEAARADLRRTKNRVANGVCPCCNRTFQNLAAHMKTKHTDYAGQEIG